MRVGYLIVLVAIVNLLLDDLHTHDDAMYMIVAYTRVTVYAIGNDSINHLSVIWYSCNTALGSCNWSLA